MAGKFAEPVQNEKLQSTPQRLDDIKIFSGPISVFGVDGKKRKTTINGIYSDDLSYVGEKYYYIYKKGKEIIFVESEDKKRTELLEAVKKLEKRDLSGLEVLKNEVITYASAAVINRDAGKTQGVEDWKQFLKYVYDVLTLLEKGEVVPQWELSSVANAYRNSIINFTTKVPPLPSGNFGTLLGGFHCHLSKDGPSPQDIYGSRQRKSNEYVLSYDSGKMIVYRVSSGIEKKIGELIADESTKKAMKRPQQTTPEVNPTIVLNDSGADLRLNLSDASGLSLLAVYGTAIGYTINDMHGSRSFEISLPIVASGSISVVAINTNGNVRSFLLTQETIEKLRNK